jgi:hypothetical protein
MRPRSKPTTESISPTTQQGGREAGRQAGRQSKPGGRFRKECNLPTGSVAYSIVYSWCLSQDRKKKG